MASVRLTSTNLNARINDWATNADTRTDTLVFRTSSMSQEDILSSAFDAGVVVHIEQIGGDLLRVSYGESLVERP
jgi:hypothetical protein